MQAVGLHARDDHFVRCRLSLRSSPLRRLLAGAAAPFARSVAVDSSFAGLVARLSEPNGYFDSDNIITNEASYLHVASQLAKVGTHGGVYIGVGPDQNFSYIAMIRPSIAFMVDIRRDNLLEHLLFKSLFAMSRNRLEYLCLLFGKRVPAGHRPMDRPADRGAARATSAKRATDSPPCGRDAQGEQRSHHRATAFRSTRTIAR